VPPCKPSAQTCAESIGKAGYEASLAAQLPERAMRCCLLLQMLNMPSAC
jgi:hypothetical protein